MYTDCDMEIPIRSPCTLQPRMWRMGPKSLSEYLDCICCLTCCRKVALLEMTKKSSIVTTQKTNCDVSFWLLRW